MRFKSFVFAVCLCTPIFAHAGEVTVYRDTWGVPHIYGDSEASASYGLGYAMAEDRLNDLYTNIRTATGTMAEFFGEEHVMIDYAMKLVRNAERCEEYYPKMPEHLRASTEGFIAGVNQYISEHPEAVPEYGFELKPWHCLAIGRAMILRWPLGTIMDDLNNKDTEPGMSSNCFSVAPKRTADKIPILLTDVHVGWDSLSLFYEARVHAPDLDMCGFFMVGSPLVGLGHNTRVGWAMTTGGPDTSDVWELKLNPDMPTQYEVDGEWKYAKMRLIKIPVKGKSMPTVMPALDTEFGPLFSEPDTEKNVAYAGNSALFEDMGVFEQMYAMVKSKNADEFYQALKMNHMMEQNIMYADCEGNIGYVRVGRSPIRPAGVDPTRPIPGHLSANHWQGVHDIDDHVRILNPESGYMQNCNVSPENMMVDCPLTPDKFIPYLYNVSWDTNGTRSERLVELLSKDDNVTKEDAKAFMMDVYDIRAPHWQKALKAAVAEKGAEFMDDETFDAAVKDLLAWDCNYTQDSTAATLMEQWRTKSDQGVNGQSILEGKALTAEEQVALLTKLAETLADLQATYGKTVIPYGDIHKVGRDGIYYPYDGGHIGGGVNGTRTVRDIEGGKGKDGIYVGENGSIAPVLMFFHKEGVESYTAFPWGQSGHKDSPHFMDQGRDLFSKRELKPTWFKKDDLLKNVASEKVLSTP